MRPSESFESYNDEKFFKYYVTFIKDDVKVEVPIYIPPESKEDIKNDLSFIPNLTTELMQRFPRIVCETDLYSSRLNMNQSYIPNCNSLIQTYSTDQPSTLHSLEALEEVSSTSAYQSSSLADESVVISVPADEKSVAEVCASSAEKLAAEVSAPSSDAVSEQSMDHLTGETYSDYLNNLHELIETSRRIRFDFGLSQIDVIYYLRQAYGFSGGLSSIHRFESFTMALSSVLELKAFLERWINEMSTPDGQRQFFECIQFCKISTATRREFIESGTNHFSTSKHKIRLNQSVLRSLEQQFHLHPRPNQSQKREICAITGLSLARVSTWFANRRYNLRLPVSKRNVKQK